MNGQCVASFGCKSTGDRGYTDTIYSSLYKTLFARGGDGKEPGIAYVPLTYIDAFDAIRTILAAGGIPVLHIPGRWTTTTRCRNGSRPA